MFGDRIDPLLRILDASDDGSRCIIEKGSRKGEIENIINRVSCQRAKRAFFCSCFCLFKGLCSGWSGVCRLAKAKKSTIWGLFRVIVITWRKHGREQAGPYAKLCVLCIRVQITSRFSNTRQQMYVGSMFPCIPIVSFAPQPFSPTFYPTSLDAKLEDG